MFLLQRLFGGKVSYPDEDLSRERLRYHVINGELEQLKDVLGRRDDGVNAALDDYGKTALHYAVYCGQITIVKWLILEGAQVNQQDVNNQVPLHMVFPHIDYYNVDVNNMKRFKTEMESCEFIRNFIALFLLNNGADPNIQDYKGSTPLHYALLQRSFTVMTQLMKKGAKLTTFNLEGVSPLHLTTSVGTLDWALVCYGDLDAQDSDGQTLLHKVMQPYTVCFSPEIVHNILKRGATVDVLNKYHQTPYDVWFMRFWNFRIKNRLLNEILAEPLCYDLHLECEKELLNHMVKLVTAGIPVRYDQYIIERIDAEVMNGSWALKKLQIDCLEEVNKLAVTPVSGSGTLSHVLRCKSSTCHYLTNESTYKAMEKILHSSDLFKHFPIYANILKNTFQKSKKRLSLIVNAYDSLLNYNRPQAFQVLAKDRLAVEYLFEYLSNTDLQNLIRSV